MARTLAEKLVEAEAAYEDLMLGRMARVFVDQNGERVEYAATNRASLASYIESLKGQLRGVSHQTRGPLGMIF